MQVLRPHPSLLSQNGMPHDPQALKVIATYNVVVASPLLALEAWATAWAWALDLEFSECIYLTKLIRELLERALK